MRSGSTRDRRPRPGLRRNHPHRQAQRLCACAPGPQSPWEEKCQLDNQRETTAMARYHSTGTNQGLRYTCGAAATGATKRNITNEDEVADALRSTVGERFAVVAPEALSPCGQVAAFSRARLVIGQHGAALSNAIFMREGAAMLELQPVPHAVFEQVCAAVGIRYLALAESGFSHVSTRAKTADRRPSYRWHSLKSPAASGVRCDAV
jgi:hypothetical protein